MMYHHLGLVLWVIFCEVAAAEGGVKKKHQIISWFWIDHDVFLGFLGGVMPARKRKLKRLHDEVLGG